ncbi:COG3650 family protein [Aurantiacibacter arachoides]|nr:hypothetical protein [Aurantiacibacter arachoides]
MAAILAALGACGAAGSQGLPGDSEDTRPYAGLAEDAVIKLVGTEPFWGGRVQGTTFTYSTLENSDGEAIAVTRFAGRGGVSFSGTRGGAAVDLAITPGTCSDGMSDRTYPFVATLQIGSEQRQGCAWREGDDIGDEAGQ